MNFIVQLYIIVEQGNNSFSEILILEWCYGIEELITIYVFLYVCQRNQRNVIWTEIETLSIKLRLNTRSVQFRTFMFPINA